MPLIKRSIQDRIIKYNKKQARKKQIKYIKLACSDV